MKYCRKCHTDKPESEFFKNKRMKDGLYGECKTCTKNHRAVYLVQHPRQYTAKEYYRDVKDEVIAAYGGVCSCCGEHRRAFLTIDHVKRDGKQHRAERGVNGVYVDAKREGYPPRYRVLCYNCNCSQAHTGICPHEKKRQQIA